MIFPEGFLRALDRQQNKTTYARITALTMDERPIETLEGRITQGTVNIDGDSAVRRTCNLTMAAPLEEQNLNYNWAINTKIKLEVGVENYIDSNYPDIIWFDQGIYVIGSFSTSYSANSCNISISAKDKMCMLNGEVGGTLNSSVDFGSMEEEVEKGVWRKVKIPIKSIIREAVHTYANEPFHNIIINDLDDTGLILQTYRYDIPMYIWRKTNSDTYEGGTLNQDQKVYKNGSPSTVSLSSFSESDFDVLMDDFNNPTSTPATIKFPDDAQEQEYHLAKIDYGETAGYTETDLVYPDDLIAKAGETITSVLDKIKNMLGEYEYFYNLYGQFVFQKKKTYLQTPWTPLSNEQTYVNSDRNQFAYIFSGTEFFTSFSNNPNLGNLKNDFSVWGTKGNNTAIHMRYAIDTKPTYYKSIAVSNSELDEYNAKYGFKLEGQSSTEYNSSDWDWRELIYRMALDYRKYNHLDNFEQKIIEANGERYPGGRTGYEQYYIDLEGFWRLLYAPSGEEVKGIEYDEDGWNKAIISAPETLLFWFDFLDTSGELSKYSVPVIGSRPKIENSKDVKAIYYKETPNIIFTNKDIGTKTGYRYFRAPQLEGMFSKSAQGRSAKETIDSLLYNHSCAIESVSINCIPIYYLEPNVRIYINDKNTGIEGEYIISKYSLPLAYNGTMSITATKAVTSL